MKTFIFIMLASAIVSANNTMQINTINTSGATNNNTLIKSDAEIAQVLITISQSEFDAAQIAARRGKSSQVKDYARTMSNEHSENIKKTKSIHRKTAFSSSSRLLNDEAKMANSQLEASSDTDFDRDYIAMKVTMHEKTLSMLNNTLIPAAQNSELKTHLQTTRDAVARHLEQARSLETSVR